MAWQDCTWRPQMEYDAKNTVQVKMKLNKGTDYDILAWLKRQKNKQGTLKALIRAAMMEEARTGKTVQEIYNIY